MLSVYEWSCELLVTHVLVLLGTALVGNFNISPHKF